MSLFCLKHFLTHQLKSTRKKTRRLRFQPLQPQLDWKHFTQLFQNPITTNLKTDHTCEQTYLKRETEYIDTFFFVNKSERKCSKRF